MTNIYILVRYLHLHLPIFHKSIKSVHTIDREISPQHFHDGNSENYVSRVALLSSEIRRECTYIDANWSSRRAFQRAGTR